MKYKNDNQIRPSHPAPPTPQTKKKKEKPAYTYVLIGAIIGNMPWYVLVYPR